MKQYFSIDQKGEKAEHFQRISHLAAVFPLFFSMSYSFLIRLINKGRRLLKNKEIRSSD